MLQRSVKRPRRAWLAAAGLVPALAFLTACGSSGSSAGAGSGSSDGNAAAPAKTCAQVDLATAPASPTTIRFGYSTVGMEPLWYMVTKPGSTKYENKWYKLSLQHFDSTGDRYVAFQANKIDAGVSSPPPFIAGNARGSVDLVALGSLAEDGHGHEGYADAVFVSKAGSGIKTIQDLKGKKIGLNNFNTEADFLAKAAIEKAGGNPQTDAQYTALPLPTQGQAVKSGKIDVGVLYEPFYTKAHSSGGVQDVFDAQDITGYGYDLFAVVFQRDYVTKNLGAVCAFLADLKDASNFTRENTQEVRKALVGSKFIGLPADVYLKIQKYYIPKDAAPTKDGLQQFMDQAIKLGILRKSDETDLSKLYLPGITLGMPATGSSSG